MGSWPISIQCRNLAESLAENLAESLAENLAENLVENGWRENLCERDVGLDGK